MIFTVTPGKILSDTEAWTAAKFNQIAQPTVSVSGTLATSDIASGAVTAPKATPGPWFFATSTSGAGSAATTKYTLAWGSNTAPASLADGLEICFKVDAANTGTVSIDTGTGGASGVEKVLRKHKGESLEAGDLRANQVVICRYGTAAAEWQLVSELGNRPVEYLAATGTDTYAATPSPAYVALSQLTGRRFALKFANANTGAATLNLNGLGALAIKKNYNIPLVANDLRAGAIVEFICDDASPQVFQMQSQPGNAPSGSLVGASRGLVIKNNGTTRIDFTADDIVLRSGAATGNTYLTVSLTGSTVTVDPSGLGANGLDSGAAVAGTWYYLYCISDGTNIRGLASTSATTPAPVIGYPYKALIGVFRISAIGPIVISTLYQQGKLVMIANTNIFTARTSVAAATYEALAGADLAAFQAVIPPIAISVFGTFGAGGGSGFGAAMAIASDAAGNGAVANGINTVPAGAGFDNFNNGIPFTIPLTTAGPNFYWKSLDNVNARNRVNVSAYSL